MQAVLFRFTHAFSGEHGIEEREKKILLFLLLLFLAFCPTDHSKAKVQPKFDTSEI